MTNTFCYRYKLTVWRKKLIQTRPRDATLPLVSPNAPQCITDVNLRDLLKKLKAHRAHLSPDEAWVQLGSSGKLSKCYSCKINFERLLISISKKQIEDLEASTTLRQKSSSRVSAPNRKTFRSRFQSSTETNKPEILFDRKNVSQLRCLTRNAKPENRGLPDPSFEPPNSIFSRFSDLPIRLQLLELVLWMLQPC